MTDLLQQDRNEGQRRLAFLVLLGITAAMLLVMVVRGTYLYHRVNEAHAKSAAEKPRLEKDPMGEDKPREAASASMEQFWEAYRTDPIFLWALVNAGLLGIGATLFYTLTRPSAATGEAMVAPPWQLLFLGVGGVIGFATTCFLGIGYVFKYWNEWSQGLKVWRELWPWWIVLAIVGGLMVTFISLISVRSLEQDHPGLRRLIYGYNAVLMGFLLLAILIVFNVLVLYFGPATPTDWTASNIYSISPESKKQLAALDKEVIVYVMLGRDPLGEDVEHLLSTCQTVTKKLKVEKLHPNLMRDQEKIDSLLKQYGLLFQEGLLLVYDPQGENQFVQIKRTGEGADDLALEDAPRMGRDLPNFRGEQAIISAIRQFREGKTAATIYFTQDSGEMSITDFSKNARGQLSGFDRGLGSLKSRLEKRGYTIKEWKLGMIDEQTLAPALIPSDASLVVVADPSATIGTDNKIKALEEYLQRPNGKMIILLDPRTSSSGEIMPTGLEKLLERYGVQVGQDIILHPPYQELSNPTMASIVLADNADTALRQAFIEQSQQVIGFMMFNVRTVRPIPGHVGHDVKPLLETNQLLNIGAGQWPETELKGDPRAFVDNLRKNQLGDLNLKMRSPSVPVAVTVRDKGTQLPPTQPHLPPETKPGDPKMVVFGDATFVCNELVDQQVGEIIFYNLFASSVNWLRDKPIILDIAPKERKAYRPNMTRDTVESLKWWPIALLLVFVLVSGISVGMMRRR